MDVETTNIRPSNNEENINLMQEEESLVFITQEIINVMQGEVTSQEIIISSVI